jgi:nucleotide-binding universal stress UspA family protein
MNEFPTSILVATDGSEDAVLAIKAASDLSARAGSELHVAHAWRRPTLMGYFSVGEAENSDIREEAERLLEEQVEQVRASGETVAGSLPQRRPSRRRNSRARRRVGRRSRGDR